MARLAGTFITEDAAGNREELSDVVNRTTPEDTPIYSMIGKEAAKSTHPEWEIDELDPPGDNAHDEGDEFDFDATNPPDRVGTYCQIFRKTWAVSATQETVDNAGNLEKVKAQKLKKGIEIRKDVEYAILSDQVSVPTGKRRFGSLASWYETNVNRGAGGANGGYDAVSGLTVAPTAGTQRAFTKDLLDDTMQQVYTSGGTTKFASVSPYVKSVFTSFMSDPSVAQFRYAASGGKNTIIATADVYEGDFGKVIILPNRVQAGTGAMASNVHLLDPKLLKMKMLRKIHNVKGLAKTGDARKGVIIGEGALKVGNEQGLGVIADVFGLTPAT